MTDDIQSKIERAVKVLGLHRTSYCCWHDANDRHVARSSFNPWTSHDDCQLLIEEVGRRGLWDELIFAIDGIDGAALAGGISDCQFYLTVPVAAKADACLRVLEADEEAKENIK